VVFYAGKRFLFIRYDYPKIILVSEKIKKK
jgi:hypothetical protein